MKVKLLLLLFFSSKLYAQDIPDRYINRNEKDSIEINNKFIVFLDTIRKIYNDEYYPNAKKKNNHKILNNASLDTFLYKVFDNVLFNKEGTINNGSGGLLAIGSDETKFSISQTISKKSKNDSIKFNPKIYKFDLEFNVKNGVGSIYKGAWQEGIELSLSRLAIPKDQQIIYKQDAFKTVLQKRLNYVNEFIKENKKYFLVDTVVLKADIEKFKKTLFITKNASIDTSIKNYIALVKANGIGAEMNNSDSIDYLKSVLEKVQLLNNLNNIKINEFDSKRNVSAFEDFFVSRIVNEEKDNLPKNLGYRVNWHEYGINMHLFKNNFESDTILNPLVLSRKGNGLFIKFRLNYSFNILKNIPEEGSKFFLNQIGVAEKLKTKNDKPTLRFHKFDLSFYNTNLLELISKAEIPLIQFDNRKGTYVITTNQTDTLQSLESFNNNFVRVNAGYSYTKFFGRNKISPLGVQIDFNAKIPIDYWGGEIKTQSILKNASLMDMKLGLIYNTDKTGALPSSLFGFFLGYTNFPIFYKKKLNDYFSFEVKYGLSFNKLFK
jgi:Tfp pilus assembly protein PilZ